MIEDGRYSERLLEELYRIYGDGRSVDFLSRSLALPEREIRVVAERLAERQRGIARLPQDQADLFGGTSRAMAQIVGAGRLVLDVQSG